MLYQNDEVLAQAVTRQVEERHQLRDQAERELIGFDHAEVGRLLLTAWNLPPIHRELAACHHQYRLSREFPRAALVLALANLLAEPGTAGDDPRVEALRVELDLDSETLLAIFESCREQVAEIRSLILA